MFMGVLCNHTVKTHFLYAAAFFFLPPRSIIFVWFFLELLVSHHLSYLQHTRDSRLSVFVLCIYDSIAGHSHTVTIHSRVFLYSHYNAVNIQSSA